MSLLAPEPIRSGGVIEVARELGVDVLAYSPLALGVLARTPGWSPGPAQATALRSGLYRRLLPGSETLRQAMEDVAQARGVSLVQVALNLPLCKAHPSFYEHSRMNKMS